MKRLEDKIALVTGGGSGIGRAICERLADEGARVAVADLNRTAADETVAALADGVGLPSRPTSPISTLFAPLSRKVRSALGAVDILVNNAGWDRMEPFVDNTPEFWTKVIDVNLRGPIHCCRAVLDDMIARGSGKIVSISSDAARVGSTGEAVYSACKGGIVSFSKTLAREMARHQHQRQRRLPGPDRHAAAAGDGRGRLRQARRIAQARHPLPPPRPRRRDRRRRRLLRLARRRLHHRAGAERQRRSDDGGVRRSGYR